MQPSPNLQSPEDQFALILSQRQLIAVCVMFLGVLGLVSMLAYVAGRSIPAAQAKMQDGAETVPAIVVEPVAPPAALGARAQTLAPWSASTIAESGDPRPGQTFWQVGVVDRGMANVSVDHLIRLGFRARLAPAPSANLHRVLVGPLMGRADLEKSKRGLDAAGFQSFLKKY
ncbi:MAG TPA: hypothetical protein VM120_14735 [Bryobacteraceae bacterium]|nr:hypothetical protein [Bryobacteraceae bacterium]